MMEAPLGGVPPAPAAMAYPRSRPTRPAPAMVLGEGAPIVILHGYGLAPRTYRRTAELLAARAMVVVPALFALGRRWTYQRAVDALVAMLDDLGLERVSLIGHSFGGGLELGLAARHPERVVELVFADTLGLSREWTLAEEAVHPVHLLRLATSRAIIDFTRTMVTHPTEMARAAWWGFTSDRGSEVATIAAAGLSCHVLWAGRDTLLSRRDGQDFAEELGASFTVARSFRGPIDHDWMYRHPALFVSQLDRVGLIALGSQLS